MGGEDTHRKRYNSLRRHQKNQEVMRAPWQEGASGMAVAKGVSNGLKEKLGLQDGGLWMFVPQREGKGKQMVPGPRRPVQPGVWLPLTSPHPSLHCLSQASPTGLYTFSPSPDVCLRAFALAAISSQIIHPQYPRGYALPSFRSLSEWHLQRRLPCPLLPPLSSPSPHSLLQFSPQHLSPTDIVYSLSIFCHCLSLPPKM